MHKAVVDSLGKTIQNIFTLLLGLTIGFVVTWQITLVAIAILPVMAVGSSLQFKFMAETGDESDKSEAARTLEETVAAIRTVTAFNLQDSLFDRFLSLLR